MMYCLKIDNSALELVEQECPKVSDEEVLIEVELTGICNTDIELLKGYYDFSGIPGHEFIGTIIDAKARPDWLGKRATADINCGCNNCRVCNIPGGNRHCPNRTTIGIYKRAGAFSQYISVPVANVHLIPDHLNSQTAVFAEPLAAALEIIEQEHITCNMNIAVLGDGKLGLLTAFALRLFTPRLLLIGHHQDKLKLAMDNDIDVCLESSMPADQFDIVVEATGNTNGLNTALKLVCPRGAIIAKTTSHQLVPFDLSNLVVNEIRLIGSRCGNIGYAIDVLSRKAIDPTPLIEAIYPYHQYQTAFEKAQQSGCRKILLAW